MTVEQLIRFLSHFPLDQVVRLQANYWAVSGEEGDSREYSENVVTEVDEVRWNGEFVVISGW